MVTQRQTLIIAGVIGGLVSNILLFAAVTNSKWLAVTSSPTSDDGDDADDDNDQNSSLDMGLFNTKSVNTWADSMKEYNGHDSSDYSSQLKATQAFAILAYLSAIVGLCAAIYATAKVSWAQQQRAHYPWTVVLFMAIFLTWFFAFLGLITFGVVKSKIDTIATIPKKFKATTELDVSIEAGITPMILLLFVGIAANIILRIGFGTAELIGIGVSKDHENHEAAILPGGALPGAQQHDPYAESYSNTGGYP
eukprot:gb/GECG01013813.1/.p1 GENE.gb/GECG01013813.1/~~gb/GECG01013813.1/.p1  ORF type:complete len:251 (+),score=31.98 gb/GECG01013813.1/:1-753(+)